MTVLNRTTLKKDSLEKENLKKDKSGKGKYEQRTFLKSENPKRTSLERKL